jgi:hypothetical protein
VNNQIINDLVQPKTNEDRDHTWRHWLGFGEHAGILDRFLSDFPEQERELLLRSFLSTYQVAHWDKSGSFLGTNKKALAGATVRTAADHLAAAFQDSFKLSPLHVPDDSRLLSSFTALFKALDNIGDQPNRQRVITPNFLRYLHRLGSNRPPKACAIHHAVDLLIVGLFSFQPGLARLFVQRTQERPRQPLELRAIIFRDASRRIIPHNNSRLLPRAEFVTVTWRNQKNGKRLDSRTQRRTRDRRLCPALCLDHVVQQVLHTVPYVTPHTLICALYNPNTKQTTHLQDEFTLNLLRSTCAMFGGKSTFGFHPHEIGNQSI